MEEQSVDDIGTLVPTQQPSRTKDNGSRLSKQKVHVPPLVLEQTQDLFKFNDDIHNIPMSSDSKQTKQHTTNQSQPDSPTNFVQQKMPDTQPSDVASNFISVHTRNIKVEQREDFDKQLNKLKVARSRKNQRYMQSTQDPKHWQKSVGSVAFEECETDQSQSFFSPQYSLINRASGNNSGCALPQTAAHYEGFRNTPKSSLDWRKNRIVMRRKVNLDRQHLQSGGTCLDTTQDMPLFNRTGQRFREAAQMGLTQTGIVQIPKRYQKYMLEVPSVIESTKDCDTQSLREALFSHDKDPKHTRDKSQMSTMLMPQTSSQVKNTKNSLDQSSIYGSKLDSLMVGQKNERMPFISRSIQEVPKKARCASQGQGLDTYRFMGDKPTINLATNSIDMGECFTQQSPRQPTTYTQMHSQWRQDISHLKKVSVQLDNKQYGVFTQIQNSIDRSALDNVQNPKYVSALITERDNYLEALKSLTSKVVKKTSPEIGKFINSTLEKLEDNFEQTNMVLLESQKRMSVWQTQVHDQSQEIQILEAKTMSTLTKENVLSNLVEQYFTMELGTKKGQKLQAANDFLDEPPLVTEKDIDEKMAVGQLVSMNAGPYIEAAIETILGSLSYNRDDDPDIKKEPAFKIDFAEKFYQFLHKRIHRFQYDSGKRVMVNMLKDTKFADKAIQVVDNQIDCGLIEECQTLRVEVESLEADLGRQKEMTKHSDELVDRANKEKGNLQRQLTELKPILEESREEVEIKERQIADKQRQLDQVGANIPILNDAVSKANARARESQLMIETMKGQVTNLQKSVALNVDEYDALTARYEDANKEVTKMNKKMQTMEKETFQMYKDKEDLEEMKRNLEDDRERTLRNLNDLSQEHSALRRKKETKADAVDSSQGPDSRAISEAQKKLPPSIKGSTTNVPVSEQSASLAKAKDTTQDPVPTTFSEDTTTVPAATASDPAHKTQQPSSPVPAGKQKASNRTQQSPQKASSPGTPGKQAQDGQASVSQKTKKPTKNNSPQKQSEPEKAAELPKKKRQQQSWNIVKKNEDPIIEVPELTINTANTPRSESDGTVTEEVAVGGVEEEPKGEDSKGKSKLGTIDQVKSEGGSVETVEEAQSDREESAKSPKIVEEEKEVKSEETKDEDDQKKLEAKMDSELEKEGQKKNEQKKIGLPPKKPEIQSRDIVKSAESNIGRDQLMNRRRVGTKPLEIQSKGNRAQFSDKEDSHSHSSIQPGQDNKPSLDPKYETAARKAANAGKRMASPRSPIQEIMTPTPEQIATQALRNEDEATMRASPSSDKLANTFISDDGGNTESANLPSTMMTKIDFGQQRQKKANILYQMNLNNMPKAVTRNVESQTEHQHMAQYVVTLLVSLSNMISGGSISMQDIQNYIFLRNDLKNPTIEERQAQADNIKKNFKLLGKSLDDCSTSKNELNSALILMFEQSLGMRTKSNKSHHFDVGAQAQKAEKNTAQYYSKILPQSPLSIVASPEAKCSPRDATSQYVMQSARDNQRKNAGSVSPRSQNDTFPKDSPHNRKTVILAKAAGGQYYKFQQ